MGRFLRVAGLTDVGQEREHNEDSYGLMPHFDLFIVADGMGGHRAGDVASRMAIEAVDDFFQATEKEDITWPFHFDPNLPFAMNRLITAIQVANSRIYQESIKNNEHQGMGTTAVSIHLVSDLNACHIAHVGDSRCYRVRGGSIELLTTDHSLVNDYLKAAPDLTEEQLAELPRNVITRALGMQESVVVDVQTHVPEPGDIFLLCSDGLNTMLADNEILEVVVDKRDDLDETCKTIINIANERGGEDNITLILAEVVEE
ncbi:MAG: Stp1/IreP family PP2C-type Ser/Thr phosphatase [Proteobacteria bacterium]|nr:Stp1/IreP family PP2C-type Ser/Thr phosphatase [Pseudomonadota bacterium]